MIQVTVRLIILSKTYIRMFLPSILTGQSRQENDYEMYVTQNSCMVFVKVEIAIIYLYIQCSNNLRNYDMN